MIIASAFFFSHLNREFCFMKKPFSIIHHNPNRIGNAEDPESAVYALSHGANALGPDVLFLKNDFWVLHHANPADATPDAPLLIDYLDELSAILQNNPSYKLNLIAFDLKDTEDHPYDFADLQKIITDHFHCSRNVTMLFSTPNNINFLGTDEYDETEHAHASFHGKGFPYVFGCGNSTFFHTIYKPLAKAVSMRDAGDSFRFVYPWTIDTKSSYRRYLDLGVDAIITNKPEKLRRLIIEEYGEKYDLDAPIHDF
jgi:hypothetical protein